MATEMHPTRWGDPGRSRPLPDSARGLVEMVFPVADRTVHDTAAVTLPAPALPADVLAAFATVVGDAHVLSDDDTRRVRTRGKSTADLLRARAGDLGDAPDAVV